MEGHVCQVMLKLYTKNLVCLGLHNLELLKDAGSDFTSLVLVG